MTRAVLPCLLAVLALAGRAEAAACCLSSSAFGIGRLAIWENGAALTGLSVAPGTGRWDETSQWVPDAAGATDTEFRAYVAGIVAVHDKVQLSARVPWVVNHRTADGLTDVGHWAGDSLVSARVEALAIGEYAELPGLAFNMGLTVPSGVPMSATKSLLAADVTGRGAWVVSGSATLERAVLPWYGQLSVGTTVPLPMASYAPGVTQRYGPTLEASLAGGRELREGLVVSLMARMTLESDLVVAGRAVPSSGARDFGVSPSVSWKFDPHWTLQGAVDSGVFFSGVGENRPGRVSVSLGLRYGFF